MRKESGQTLLEIVVALGLLLVIVTGIVVTTINGLKNSQVAKSQTQAAKLAQEGIDKLRAISLANCPVRVSADTTSPFWSFSTSMPTSFKLNGDCEVGLAIQDPLTAPYNDTYTRKITVEDDGTDGGVVVRKKVTVVVSWNDFTGSHESRLVTYVSY